MKRNTVYSCWQALAVLICLLPWLVSAEEAPKHTSTFNQSWLKTLVSIEVWDVNEPNEPGKNPRSIGSGFLVNTPGNHLALVTARHVVLVQDEEKNWRRRPNLAYRLNRRDEKADLFSEAQVAKIAPGEWFISTKHDVACRLMVKRRGVSDVNSIPSSLFLTGPELEAGAPLFVIGFPMGQRSEEYAVPVLRGGMVARVDSEKIIADAFVFPGNSGGPVVYAPVLKFGSIFRTSIIQETMLVGLVSGHINYTDVAISPQTKRTRITFEENSGLCNVVPASAILELFESPEFKAVDISAEQTEGIREEY